MIILPPDFSVWEVSTAVTATKAGISNW